MKSTASNSPSSSVRVYRCSPRIRLALLGVWLFFMLLSATPLFLGLETHEANSIGAGLLVAGCVSAIMLPVFWFAGWRYPRLVLGPDGVALHQVGFTLDTTWENVVSLRRRPGFGLVLDTPLQSRGAERLAAAASNRIIGAGFYDEAELALIYQQRYIPLGPFAYWFDRGDLRPEIERRASGLGTGVETEGHPRKRRALLADASGRPLPVRRLVLVVIIILLSLAAGVSFSLDLPRVHRVVAMTASLAVCFAAVVYSIANVLSAIRRFRQRRIAAGTLATALGLILALTALSALAAAIGIVAEN